MALSDADCLQAYAWIIEQLSQAHAEDVVREMEAIIRAGTTREEQADRRSLVTVRAHLSPREQLAVALRVLLATASVPLMLQSVGRTAQPPTTRFRWLPDYLGDDGPGAPDIAATFDEPGAPVLRDLDAAARSVASLLAEFEAGQ